MLTALALVALVWPQDAPRPGLATTPNGWPILPPAAPVVRPQARAPEPDPGGVPAREGAAASPLLPVFRAVGSPADAAALGGVTAVLQATVYDHRGAVLGEREIVHDADFTVPDRDRLALGADTVYGRDGGAVFAHYRGLAFPNLEDEARDELAWFGLVVRVPWVFADAARYDVAPREELLLHGRPMSRYRIALRPPPGEPVRERFELWCDPHTSEPRVLVIQPGDPAARPCRVRLLDFAAVGNVRIPRRRILEARDGTRALELVATELDAEQEFGKRHFAPPPR